jgi:hypothetical protein
MIEDRAIEMARQRSAAATRYGAMDEMKRMSDEEATEQAALESVLRASREDFDSCVDLERALELSAQAEIQAEIMRSVVEQSEEELIKKVLEDSLKVASPEDAMVEAALQQSLAAQGGVPEDDEVQAAIKRSMAEIGKWMHGPTRGLFRPPWPRADSGGCPVADEDQQLMEIIKQSEAEYSRQQADHGKAALVALRILWGGGDRPLACAAGGGQAKSLPDEDPELAAAIALSLGQVRASRRSCVAS